MIALRGRIYQSGYSQGYQDALNLTIHDPADYDLFDLADVEIE